MTQSDSIPWQTA